MRTILMVISALLFSTVVNAQACQHKKQCQHHGAYHKFNRAENSISDSIDVLNYNIYLDITDFGNSIIAGNCEVTFTPKVNGIQQLPLDLLQLNIDSIVSGGILTYTYNDTLLLIDLPASLNTTDTSSVTVYYNGSPQGDPAGWGGWYFQSGYAYNLGVGFGANPHNYGRVWHPCFDNFVERATYTITVLTNNGRTSYCNGYIDNEVTMGDTLIRTWQMDDEIPTYLASVAVSDYTHTEQTYISITNDTIPMFLTSRSTQQSNMVASFVNLGNSMAAFENAFGPFLWNRVGFCLVPFSSGAMEHATNIAYPAVAANGSLSFETLMAHELSHHWWGDLVTCRTQEDMWINEGMASYCEKIFLEELYGPQAYKDEVRENHRDVLHNAHISDEGYRAISGIPHAFTYGDHSYNKGADVAHTLRSYMGDSLFFAGTTSFLAANPFTDVDAYDFRDHLNGIAGVDVTAFFDNWVFAPGFPHFSVDSFEVNGSGPYDVTVYVKQKLTAAPNYYTDVPLQVTFKDQNWTEHYEQIIMSGPLATFQFTTPIAPTLVMLDVNEKISDAITGESVTIDANSSTQNLGHAYITIYPQSVTDSVYIRAEHNWTAPDPKTNNANAYNLSPNRYWKIVGLVNSGFHATAKFNFNGRDVANGNLDNELLVDVGNGEVEDSIVLLYRPNTSSDWEEFPYYTLSTAGPNTDKQGSITVDSLWLGEYTFAMRVNNIGIGESHETSSPIAVFPNPAGNEVTLDLTALAQESYAITISDINGKTIHAEKVTNGLLKLDTSRWASGTYIIAITQRNKFISSGKVVIEK